MIERLKNAAADALVFAVRWSIVIIVIIFAVNYVLGIRQAALHGARALAMIGEYQAAGVLPTSLPQKEAPKQ